MISCRSRVHLAQPLEPAIWPMHARLSGSGSVFCAPRPTLCLCVCMRSMRKEGERSTSGPRTIHERTGPEVVKYRCVHSSQYGTVPRKAVRRAPPSATQQDHGPGADSRGARRGGIQICDLAHPEVSGGRERRRELSGVTRSLYLPYTLKFICRLSTEHTTRTKLERMCRHTAILDNTQMGNTHARRTESEKLGVAGGLLLIHLLLTTM